MHVSQNPFLDGTLGDPLWQLANRISDFRQREPDSGKASTEKTEVRILYTRDEIFFGLLALHGWAARARSQEIKSDDTDVGANLTYTKPWMQLFTQHFRVARTITLKLDMFGSVGAWRSYVDATLIQRLKKSIIRRIEWEGGSLTCRIFNMFCKTKNGTPPAVSSSIVGRTARTSSKTWTFSASRRHSTYIATSLFQWGSIASTTTK